MSISFLDQIDKEKLPNHVAIIMDGNGRWAKKNGKERTFGHKSALSSVRSSIESCRQLGIKYLTLYAFSSENWNRPKLEVNILMTLLSSAIKDEIGNLQKNGIRLNVIGNFSKLPDKAQKDLIKAMDITKEEKDCTLTLALSYGAKEEILHAVHSIAKQYKNGSVSDHDFNEDLIQKNLYTHNLPMVDFMIRTSGETRISNFLLWQIAYSELYFTDVLWPDFNEKEFYKAILDYQNRERRFGKTSEQLIS